VTALRAISNDTKIIILLRHPVDRAESLYNHRVNTERNHHLPARVMNHTINEVGGGPLDPSMMNGQHRRYELLVGSCVVHCRYCCGWLLHAHVWTQLLLACSGGNVKVPLQQ
jgi:hypothetical protein